MTTNITARLTGLAQEGGLTRLDLQDVEGKAHTAWIESGFGLRQLHEIMGGSLNSRTLLTYHLKGSLVHAVEDDQ